jgi:hypothetical protein
MLLHDHSGGMAAVTHEYHTEKGSSWYAVTENKIRFDGNDENTITTVVMTDSLARVLYTAKSGEVWRDGRRDTGWNISGAVEYDGKGRVVAEGRAFGAYPFGVPEVTQNA